MFFLPLSRKRAVLLYPLCLFLIAANGSLTGDIFNLFVCFEVMLVFLWISKVPDAAIEPIKYVLINMISFYFGSGGLLICHH